MKIIKGGALLLIIVASFQIVQTYPKPLCPNNCYCTNQFATCTNLNLTFIPNGFEKEIPTVDFSFNNFQRFPNNWTMFNNLLFLNFSYNKLVTLKSPIIGLENLHSLDLSHNLFSKWTFINFYSFKDLKLKYLDLSYNYLETLPPTNQLEIHSLKSLKLINCSIKSLINNNLLQNLTNISELYLAKNPFTMLDSSFKSNSLEFLDLSQCNLKLIVEKAFVNLEALKYLYVDQNVNLKKFISSSNSLETLDLSYCNLDEVPKGMLPQLRMLNLTRNNLRMIFDNNFKNFSKLTTLQLNDNTLTAIEPKAFVGLDSVEEINLSGNRLSTLDISLIYSNKLLTDINLSRNYFQEIPKFVSDSLRRMDISRCEIVKVYQRSLSQMSQLEELNLSHNMITYLPDYFEGKRLLKLDVSFCRINTVNNRTFVQMMFLNEVNLSGNRLTTTSPINFETISYLDVSDNPWRCDCELIKEFYDWLVQTRKDTTSLICQSPDKYEGLPWIAACQNTWHPELIKKDSIWWYSTAVIVTIFAILCIILITRRIYVLKEKRQRAADQRRRNEEREALRRMQRLEAEHRERTDIVNAPDPREFNPPSYNEALLLPKLDSSHPSLAGSLHSLASKQSLSNSNTDVRSRPRRKRRRRKSNSSEGQRASRVVVDTSTSEPEPEPRTTLESDF